MKKSMKKIVSLLCLICVLVGFLITSKAWATFAAVIHDVGLISTMRIFSRSEVLMGVS